MGKHLKGSTGTSMGGRVSSRNSNWKARQKRFLDRQRRLSGKCGVLYDRDSETGAIQQSLTAHHSPIPKADAGSGSL